MKKQIVIVLSLLTLSTATFAKQQKVKVLDVQPVYEYLVVEKPVEYCRPVSSGKISTKHNGALIGSVVGATIGNLSSERHNKTPATVIGALIGGVVGNQLNNNQTTTAISPTMHCTIRYVNTEKVRVIRGYEYWYRINSKMYKGFSTTQPNRYIVLH